MHLMKKALQDLPSTLLPQITAEIGKIVSSYSTARRVFDSPAADRIQSSHMLTVDSELQLKRQECSEEPPEATLSVHMHWPETTARDAAIALAAVEERCLWGLVKQASSEVLQCRDILHAITMLEEALGSDFRYCCINRRELSTFTKADFREFTPITDKEAVLRGQLTVLHLKKASPTLLVAPVGITDGVPPGHIAGFGSCGVIDQQLEPYTRRFIDMYNNVHGYTAAQILSMYMDNPNAVRVVKV